jgi:5-methylcytosine-specific restriction enzyme A
MINIIKHGVNLVRHKLRDVGKPSRSGKWRAVEKKFILENPNCAACGGKKNLQVHHISPYHLFRELELDPNNLITLCMSFKHECHYRIGHLSNWHGYNPNIRKDAAEILAHPSRLEEIIKLGICKF